MSELLQSLVIDFIQLLVALLLVYGIAFLKSKLAGTPYDVAVKKVIQLVYLAEDMFKESGKGEEKKQWVLEQISLFLKQKKINLSAEEIMEILEETVSIINILEEEKALKDEEKCANIAE